MLIARFFLIVLAVLLISNATTSQGAGDHKTIAQHYESAEQNKDATNNAIALVEKYKPESGHNTAEYANHHPDAKLNIDRELAEYTGQLAFFTKWLVYVTVVLALIAIWQGVQLRRSVNLARKEFISTHRPKIILRDATSEQHMGELIVVDYILANIGETPAKIVTRALNVNVFKGWGFAPDNLPAVDSVDSDIDSIPLKPGEQVHLSFKSPTLRWSGDNDTCHEFIEPEYGMFFSGQIIYEDDNRTRRHTGFRRKFSLDQHRFLPVDGGRHYEYQD